MTLEFNLLRRGRTAEAQSVVVRQLVIAGWTGRDAASTEAHIRELEAIGVPRAAERSGVSLAKQLCAKPVGRELWLFREVAGHWDDVLLRSWAVSDGGRRLYQKGSAAALLRPEELLKRFQAQVAIQTGAVMFCGTLPVIGALGHADRFEMRLEDPVLGRSIEAGYAVEVLPVVT